MPMRALRSRVMYGKSGTRHPAAYKREKNDSRELGSDDSFHEVASVWD